MIERRRQRLRIAWRDDKPGFTIAIHIGNTVVELATDDGLTASHGLQLYKPEGLSGRD
jgi:hypothetical protein